MKKHLKKFQTLFVDVDGTLIIWSGAHPGRAFSGSPKVNTKLADWLITTKKGNPNVQIYVWSRGGQQHARWAVQYAHLDGYVAQCMAKPDLFVDDSFTWLKKRSRMRPDLTMAEMT